MIDFQNLRALFGAAIIALFSTAAAAQPAPDALATPGHSVKLTTVIFALPAGAPYLKVTQGLFCIAPLIAQSATGVRESQPISPYTAVFEPALKNAGYNVVSAIENLFGQSENAADYQVAAVITDMKIDGCVMLAYGATVPVRGKSAMTVEWQVFAPLTKQVVARLTTSATATLDKSEPGGVAHLITEAFASNSRALAANPDFRAAISVAAPKRDEPISPTKQDVIALSGSLKAPKMSVADATGSVVTLLTGSGSGSAVLVSDDGYFLTNAHVVGEEKELRVRWSDGIETVGQVIRSHKARDIALVKTSSRDRSPLPIKRGALTPGQKVFAIGSPKGKEFSGTVSSGIVSANRIVDGMRFIQSDVMVSPGSSGGALLDENAALIGFTDLGVDNNGRDAGLHLFIPVGDALDFLNLSQQ